MPDTFKWTINGITIELIADRDSTVITQNKGGFEHDTLLHWIEMCRGAKVVLDVGCYTGLFSILAAKLGCKVIAFEPMTDNYQRCIDNFALNQVAVDLHYAAAAEKDGPVVIKFNPHVTTFLTSGASLIRPSGGAPGQSSDHAIEGIAIDSLKLPRLDAIKIDVERGEPIVLRGARGTLERCRPRMIVEVLGAQEGEDVLGAVSGYEHVATLDERNWVMEPKA